MIFADIPLALRSVKTLTSLPSGILPNALSSRRCRGAPLAWFSTIANINEIRIRTALRICMPRFSPFPTYPSTLNRTFMQNLSCEALSHKVPVDHIEPGSDIIGPLVLVFEIIRVLPNIDAQQRMLALAQRRVLVRRRFNFQFPAFPYQPGPAAPKNFRGGFREFILKTTIASEAFFN